MKLDEYHRKRSEATFRRNRIGLGLEAAERADRLRDRFKAIHGVSIVRTVCAMTLAALAIIGVGLFWYFGTVPDSDGTL